MFACQRNALGSSRFLRPALRLTGLLAAGSLGLGSANAAEALMHAEQQATPASSFTLDFGAFGQSSSFISDTEFDLVVDSVAETARFTSYLQYVDPLTLPGGISTGDITVTIVPGSSSGAFVRGATHGEFNTTEMYRIHFTGDLSAYGLFTPVDLPGASHGRPHFATNGSGEAQLRWEGTVALPNPFDPEHPIPLSYVCLVNTEFESDQPVRPHDGDLNCDGTMDFFDVDPFVLALFDAAGYAGAYPSCDRAKADVNDDAAINTFDVDPFVNLLFN